MSGGGTARRRLAALALGLVVAFVLAEVLLRLAGVAEPYVTKRLLENLDDPSVRYHCYASNPHGEMRGLPDLARGKWRLREELHPPVNVPLDRADETPWCVEYRTGATGVRGAAPTPVPAPGVVRIAGIGDSFAYGDGVPQDRTLFAHLERALGDDIEVLNCAQSGADLELDVRTLEWVVGAYRPQRAVVVFVPNDVALSDELRARQDDAYDLINVRAAGDAPWPQRVSRVARLVSAASAMRSLSDDTLALYRDSYDPAVNGENLDRLQGTLRALASLSGGQSVLVLYPLMLGFEDGYPLQDVHDRVRAMAEREGLRVLDLAPAFDGRDTEALWVHPVDHHPNGAAHAIAAEALARWLRDDVPGFLPPR